MCLGEFIALCTHPRQGEDGDQSTMGTVAAMAALGAIYNQLLLIAFAVAAAVGVIFSPLQGITVMFAKCDCEWDGMIQIGCLNRLQEDKPPHYHPSPQRYL